ncbi:MAG: transcription elongation factor GreA [Chlorobi bacterium]|nr:transcription elongation factor GreA [Chlorobiota bacterium]
MSKIAYFSKEGYEKLKKELQALLDEKPKIAQRIAEARELGDLSENSEYHAAREALALLEMKIHQLQETLANARVLDEELDTDMALILSTVTFENLDTGQETSYTLVSPGEADFSQNKISIESPIGKALLRKRVGDIVEVQVPAGLMRLKIKNITR